MHRRPALLRICISVATVAASSAAALDARVEAPSPRSATASAPATLVLPAGPRSVRRLVFVCTTPEVTTFSDRPCGPAPARRELRVDLAGPSSGEGASVRAAAPRAATRPARAGATDRPGEASDTGAESASAQDADSARERQCERLERAVVSLTDQMRTGYSARDAARLWQRWREAKSRLREADCTGSG
jgi:hypothetical protein